MDGWMDTYIISFFGGWGGGVFIALLTNVLFSGLVVSCQHNCFFFKSLIISICLFLLMFPVFSLLSCLTVSLLFVYVL